MTPAYLAALHVISVVAWFSGLFYLGRLFVYHREAQDKPEPEKTILSVQFELMEKRLYYMIMVPAMLATLIFGIWLMVITQYYQFGWMHLKLFFVAVLVVYHHKLNTIRRAMKRHEFSLSSFKLRVLNEVPTVLLIMIVFTIYLKNMFSGLWGAVVMIVASVAVVFLVRSFKRRRNRK